MTRYRSEPFEWLARALPATDIYKAKWQEREQEGDSVRTEFFVRVRLTDGIYSLEDWLQIYFGHRFSNKVMKNLLSEGKAVRRNTGPVSELRAA